MAIVLIIWWEIKLHQFLSNIFRHFFKNQKNSIFLFFDINNFLKTIFIFKKNDLSESSLFSKTNSTDKHHKMKVAIQKIYFSINPQDNVELDLKNTKNWSLWSPAFLKGSRRSTTTWKRLHYNSKRCACLLPSWKMPKWSNGKKVWILSGTSTNLSRLSVTL